MRPRKEPPTLAPPALNAPDPVNAPLEYTRLDEQENWRSDAETVEVLHDERVYYYEGIVGNEVRLPGKPE